MTGQLRVSHDTFHEIFHEHGHLIVPTQPLIVRAVLFCLILTKQLLSRRVPICLVNIHWRLLLLRILLLLHENGGEWTFLHVRGWLRRLRLDLWQLNRLVEKLSPIVLICSIWFARCPSALNSGIGIVCIVLILLLVWDWLKVPTPTLLVFLNLIPTTICCHADIHLRRLWLFLNNLRRIVALLLMDILLQWLL